MDRKQGDIMEKQPVKKRVAPWKIAVFSIGAAILLGGLLTAWIIISNTKTSNTIAKVYQDGKEIYSADLSKVTEPYTHEVTGTHGEHNVVLVEPGRISMKEANCPDQICVHTGAIDSGLLPITCLPNRVIVRIEGTPD